MPLSLNFFYDIHEKYDSINRGFGKVHHTRFRSNYPQNKTQKGCKSQHIYRSSAAKSRSHQPH